MQLHPMWQRNTYENEGVTPTAYWNSSSRQFQRLENVENELQVVGKSLENSRATIIFKSNFVRQTGAHSPFGLVLAGE